MPNKYITNGKNIFNQETGKTLERTTFLRGVVTSNNDISDAGRIRVRIKGVDDHLNDVDLPYSFPMMPKFFNITPKRGEVVFIIVASTDNPYIDRMYFGPLIAQPQNLFRDTFIAGSTGALDTGFSQLSPAPSTIPENKGVYPNKEDVSIQGRDNSDITLKSKEILMRAGQYDLNTKAGDIPKFNLKTPSFIQIKNDVVIERKEDNSVDKGGVINIVSSKINLLTHKDGSPRFILNNQDDMISSDELERIISEAHPMVFGDTLINYLKLLRNAMINHVHAYHGMTAEDLSGRNDVEDFLAFDLNSLISKNIKIN